MRSGRKRTGTCGMTEASVAATPARAAASHRRRRCIARRSRHQAPPARIGGKSGTPQPVAGGGSGGGGMGAVCSDMATSPSGSVSRTDRSTIPCPALSRWRLWMTHLVWKTPSPQVETGVQTVESMHAQAVALAGLRQPADDVEEH